MSDAFEPAETYLDTDLDADEEPSLLDRLRGTGVGVEDPNIVGDVGPTDIPPGRDPDSDGLFADPPVDPVDPGLIRSSTTAGQVDGLGRRAAPLRRSGRARLRARRRRPPGPRHPLAARRTPSGPRPLVLIGHGATADKRADYVVALARRLAGKHRFAAASIDGPGHGDRRPPDRNDDIQVFSDFLAEWSREGSTDDVVGRLGGRPRSPAPAARGR